MNKKEKKKKEWTPNGYIFSALRKVWRWSPYYRNCKKAVSCSLCQHHFEADETKLADHIEPVVDPATGFQTWDIYIARMFFGKLQALCDTCHKAKTKAEGVIRRANRKKAA